MFSTCLAGKAHAEGHSRYYLLHGVNTCTTSRHLHGGPIEVGNLEYLIMNAKQILEKAVKDCSDCVETYHKLLINVCAREGQSFEEGALIAKLDPKAIHKAALYAELAGRHFRDVLKSLGE